MTRLDEFVKTYKKTTEMLDIPSLSINKTFFFDQSNNIKKGIIGYDKDNNDDLENLYFVIGGIAINNKISF